VALGIRKVGLILTALDTFTNTNELREGGGVEERQIWHAFFPPVGTPEGVKLVHTKKKKIYFPHDLKPEDGETSGLEL